MPTFPLAPARPVSALRVLGWLMLAYIGDNSLIADSVYSGLVFAYAYGEGAPKDCEAATRWFERMRARENHVSAKLALRANCPQWP